MSVLTVCLGAAGSTLGMHLLIASPKLTSMCCHLSEQFSHSTAFSSTDYQVCSHRKNILDHSRRGNALAFSSEMSPLPLAQHGNLRKGSYSPKNRRCLGSLKDSVTGLWWLVCG